MKKLAILLTLAILAGGFTYLRVTSAEAIGEMTVESLSGQVTIVRAGTSTVVGGDAPLQPGDLLTTDPAGAARLRLSGDRLAWLGSSASVLVVDTTSLEARTGSVRAKASDDMEVSFGGVLASASDAHFRIDQGFGSGRAASYGGDVRLSRPGQARVTVAGLFEAPVVAGRLPSTSRPYRFDPDDEWDADLLADVIYLDQELEQYGDGLASQLGNSRPTLGYFKGLAGKRVPFVKSYLKRPTQDLLIGFSVADNSAVGSLERAFRDAFRYRDLGGRWGVVATILQAPGKALLADLGAFAVATGVVGGGASDAEPQFTLAAAEQGASGSGPAIDGGGGTTQAPPPGGGGGNPQPPDDPPPSEQPPKDCSSGPDCTIKEVQDQLPSGEPSPSPSEEPPITDGLIDPVNPQP